MEHIKKVNLFLPKTKLSLFKLLAYLFIFIYIFKFKRYKYQKSVLKSNETLSFAPV